MKIASAIRSGDINTAYTLFALVKPTAAGDNAQSVRWLCIGGEGSGSLIHFLSLRPYDATPEFSAAVGAAQSSEVGLTSGITTINGVTALLCMTYDGSGEANFYVDGVLQDTATGLDSTYPTETMDGHLMIGDQPNESFSLIGNVGDILIYDSALSAGDREDVEGFLTAKYDL
jgi:hypothetical protein